MSPWELLHLKQGFFHSLNTVAAACGIRMRGTPEQEYFGFLSIVHIFFEQTVVHRGRLMPS